MSRWCGWWNRPIFLISLWSLAAIRPILTVATPCTDDYAFHLLRLTQLVHLLKQGVFYSRWAPDMAWGYGLPFFNFYAPLAYYVAALPALVLGLNWGLKLTLAFSVVGGGWALYALAREYVSPSAALLAAVAYMYAPYLGYDIYFRGNLAESLAWALLPLALWAMRRLARAGGQRRLAFAALAYAAVLLTHNVFALIFSPLLAAYGVWEAIQAASAESLWRRLGRPAAALALGLALAAFFWLPALLERPLVYSDRLLVPPVFVYWNNFISLRELLAPPLPVRPDLINPSPLHSLGLAPALLAALVVLGRRHLTAETRRAALFFGLATLLYSLGMLPLSAPLWARLPLAAFVQFPWRLLGPAALCLALGVGFSAESLLPHFRRVWLPLPALLVAVSALFWLTPRYCPGLEQPDVAAIAAYEQATATIGTTAKGEYVPRSVAQFPEAAPDGLIRSGGEVSGVKRRGGSAEFSHTSPTPQSVSLNQFAYPGWRAQVDGVSAPLGVSRPYGLLTLDLPAGAHTVRLTFGETPTRRAADALSGVALAVTLMWLRPTRRIKSALRPPPAVAPSLLVWLLAGLALAGLAPRLAWPRLRDGALSGLSRPLSVVYGDGMTLLGFDLPRDRWRADEPLAVTLYWTAQQPLARQYRATVALRDADGVLWTPKQSEPPRHFRQPFQTTDWAVGQYAEDLHTVTPLPGAPPGQYELTVTLFDRDSLIPTPPPGQTSPEVVLATIMLDRPRRPATWQPQFALTPQPGEALQLLGYSQDRSEARPGDPFLLTLFWQAGGGNSAETFLQLSLRDSAGAIVYTTQRPLVSSQFPTSRWQPGDRWLGQHRLRLPAGLVGDEYAWQLALLPQPPAWQAPELAPFVVRAPERLAVLPTLTYPRHDRLGDLAILRGFNFQADATQLSVTLAWEALQASAVSYRVFVHLLAADGRIVAQSDGEPANWQYPTTAWLPGDFILDAHSLTLPPGLPSGDYGLIAGLYEPVSGARLESADHQTYQRLLTWRNAP